MRPNRRGRRGRFPRLPGWRIETAIGRETEWFVSIRPDPSSRWASIKLHAAKPVRERANYLFGWNGRRFAENRDFKSLAETKPELVYELRGVLASPPGSETRQ